MTSMTTTTDALPLQPTPKRTVSKKKPKEGLKDNDDFAGVFINAGKSINVREMIIIWLWFLILHSDIFIERFLCNIAGACDENKSLTMNGTIYASIIMMVGVIIIDMVYR